MGSKLEKLTAEQRRQAQQATLASPRMQYGLLARLLFMTMDLVYGRKKTFSKFKVLERTVVVLLSLMRGTPAIRPAGPAG
jgi:hypothetical protein